MSELNDMTCAELADVAAELALGVLTGRERAMAIAHLDQCDECREYVRQLMATGEELLELIPAAEPPAGFETRVLARLGLPVPAQERPAQEPEQAQADIYPQLLSRREANRRYRGLARRTRPGADQPGAPPAGPGGPRRPGRVRRLLSAAAVALAVIAAGLGGWGIGVGTSPAATSASGPLLTASLLSAAHEEIGQVFVYSGSSRWVYMNVDLEAGNERVTCQVVSESGQVTTIGSFRLADGYGSWGGGDRGDPTPLHSARLVAADGTVLASATFANE